MTTEIPGRSFRISQVTELLGISADTLRYYEKIKLPPPIARTPSGVRAYGERDLSRLRFIQRAKSMNFSLEEIGKLLEMRESPQTARDEVRTLTKKKLAEVEDHLSGLEILRKELRLLVNLCQGSADGCPIIDELEDS